MNALNANRNYSLVQCVIVFYTNIMAYNKTMKNEYEQIISSITARLDKPIVVIGLMGVGKTRLGRTLADTLNLPFYDSDDAIEEAAGMRIPDIFEKFGEPYFRDGEHRVIKRLLEGEHKVLATGGGAIMTPETADLIWGKTVSIWVQASLKTMISRTSKNANRPLLNKGNPEEILKALMETRYPTYEKADIMIESDAGSIETIIENLVYKIDAFV